MLGYLYVYLDKSADATEKTFMTVGIEMWQVC